MRDNPLLPPDVASAIAGSQMPHYNGAEPCELDIQRINKCMQEGRFDDLSRDHQRWVTHRLMPSLTRFGVYPPPSDAKTSTVAAAQR
jgi:hypothetical protein